MLQNIRDNAGGFGALLMLGLLILAFAIWGIDFQFGANQPVVKVNGTEVSNNLIANAYNQQIQRFQEFYPNGIPEVTQAELKNSVIEQFVRSELLNQHVAEEGYSMSDSAVMGALMQIPQFQMDGKFDTAAFDMRARQIGMSSDGLFNEYRDSQVLQQWSDGFINSSFVTKDEAQLRGRLESESRTVRETLLPVSKLLADTVIEESAVQADYDFNQSEYLTEERIKIDYIELDPAALGESISISEDDIKARYEDGAQAGEYSSPEQRNARHILIAVNDGRDDETARSMANDVRARIAAGEDFAELAKELSDDAGSKPSGGELGWNSGEGYVGPFRDALFSMTEGQVSEPIKTRFGYHVIRAEGVRGTEPKPLEEVRVQIEQQLKTDAGLDRLSELVNEVDELVYDIDDSLGSAAETAGVEVQETTWFTRAGGGGIASFPQVREVAFSQQVLNDKLNSNSIELDGKYVYIRLNQHEPARTMTLEEVRPLIEARLKREAASEQVAALGNDLVNQLQQGSALDVVAASAELEVSEAKEISRLDQGLPAEAAKGLFAATLQGDSPAYGGVQLANGDYYIYELQSIKEGDALAEDQITNVARANANMELAAYIASLREQADIQVKSDQLLSR
ncbi:MAG: SurA N-terminal domain-containing protein [Gammaproteobacteria bacterium]